MSDQMDYEQMVEKRRGGQARHKCTVEMASTEYLAEAARRFGTDQAAWRFVCPACGHVQSVADYQAAGAPEGAIGFSCIGRYLGGAYDWFQGTTPCNYTSGGLLRVGGVRLTDLDGAPMYFHLDVMPVPAPVGEVVADE